MANTYVERTYNAGQYQSLKIHTTADLDISNVDDFLRGIKYLTLLLDLAYYNYISTSPVMNNTLTKEVMEQFKEALEKYSPPIIIEKDKEEQK